MEAAGLLGCGIGINVCQPGKRRWEGSRTPRYGVPGESGVIGLQWAMQGDWVWEK